MSAIWGAVNLQGNDLTEENIRRMESVYRTKKIDRIDSCFRKHFYFGCGIQFAIKEAEEENFPYADGKGLFCVADAILDNRDELRKCFKLTSSLSQQGIDGSILFEAVKQDMDRALNQMLGAYAFAFYNENQNKLWLASDAVGNRSVYYLYDGNCVYFSTLMEAIVELFPDLSVNHKWFKNYFEQENLQVVAEARETPYERIYRVEPGEIVCFLSDGVKREEYWNPFNKRKKLKLETDTEYKLLVNSVFQKCVQSVIREGKETAILLSGGLDSNAVAAYAAPFLAEKEKKLYSFTSVPDKSGSPIPANEYYVEDESAYIYELKKYHENLEASFIDTSEGDLLEENRKVLEILEIPFKTVLNMPWIYKAYLQAASKGCGIMLSGQYGNITISFGNFQCLFVTLLRDGRICRLVKEVNAYSKKYKKSRKWIYREALKASPKDHFRYYSQYMYDKVSLRQIGEAEVKFSLETGIIPRDPTRDKRLIELVLSLPLEQFVQQGCSRRLVRQYMADIIPQMIISDEFHRGRQGVGCRRLMKKDWRRIAAELQKDYNMPFVDRYFDTESAKQLLYGDVLFRTENEFEMIKLMYSGLTCEYLRKIYGT